MPTFGDKSTRLDWRAGLRTKLGDSVAVRERVRPSVRPFVRADRVRVNRLTTAVLCSSRERVTWRINGTNCLIDDGKSKSGVREESDFLRICALFDSNVTAAVRQQFTQ